MLQEVSSKLRLIVFSCSLKCASFAMRSLNCVFGSKLSGVISRRLKNIVNLGKKFDMIFPLLKYTLIQETVNSYGLSVDNSLVSKIKFLKRT
jgi:hypothetical protein